MTYSPWRFLPSILYKGRPVHLTFFVTRRCNARCRFCFYLEDASTKSTGVPELTLGEIDGVSRSMGDLLWVAFSGGEIFLRRDLFEISKTIYENNRPSVMLFPTNGLAPPAIRETMGRVLDSCPKSTVVVKLSIDGLGETHDSLRGIKGSFDRALETYQALAPLLDEFKNFELGINTVFCPENQDCMEDIIGFVKGLEKITTHTISLVRGEIPEEAKAVDLGKFLLASERLARGLKDKSSPRYRFGGASIKAAQDILQRRLIYRTAAGQRRLLPCYAGRLNVVLTETGEVYPCESFGERWRLGNVRDYALDIKTLLRDDKAREVISGIKNGCFCTHECYTMTNILFNPSTYPALLRELRSIT